MANICVFVNLWFVTLSEHIGNKRKHSQQYEIQTRGAKLPKYSFERKTHKKIYKDPTEERRRVVRCVSMLITGLQLCMKKSTNPNTDMLFAVN